jgi:hypothetical protein
MSNAGGKNRRKVFDVRFPEPSIMTPMYTVANCFGEDKNAARANIHTLMPHVANTAVVTNNLDLSGRVYSERGNEDAQ